MCVRAWVCVSHFNNTVVTLKEHDTHTRMFLLGNVSICRTLYTFRFSVEFSDSNQSELAVNIPPHTSFQSEQDNPAGTMYKLSLMTQLRVISLVFRMRGQALLVVVLCVCEAVGAQETPSLTDVWREVRVLRGRVADLRGDNAGWLKTVSQ